jgi:hypothetical protein
MAFRMRQTHRIHPEDLMKTDALIDSVLSLALITILGLLLALLRLLS